MSAIFGIIRFDGAEADTRGVSRMGATMRHRAPDGIEIAALGPVCLGYCKMRVQREDVFDAQPLSNDRGDVTLVAEGRLDNREELAETFGIDADALRDLPDSALVLAAYKHWGADCAEHLIGDFAFALWDARARRLVLARDHMGQRHLLFHRGEHFLAFASEIKALWALEDVPRAMSDDATMRRLLVLRDSKAPDTLFEGIEGLRGGERMVIGRDGSVDRRRYWTPRAAPEHEGQDEAYYIAAYRRVLGEAVSCRLRRLERRSALHMSGGFDSSAVAGLAGPVLREQGRTILGIASVMAEEKRGQQKRDARPMVEFCARDMPHLDVHYLTREGIVPFGGLDEALPRLDGPASPVHYVYAEAARIARTHDVRQLMDGHGGDYTLNPRDSAAVPRLLMRGDPVGYVREVMALRKRFGMPLLPLLKRHVRHMLDPLIRRAKIRLGRSVGTASAAGFVRAGSIDVAVASGVVARDEFGLDTGIAIEMRDRIGRVVTRVGAQVSYAPMDIAAWTEGLAVTRPFHDKRVVELALAIPEALYFRNGRNRYLACRALADIYPPEFQDRPFHNDDRIPDIGEVLAVAGPELVARAERLPDDLVDREALIDALRPEQPWGQHKGLALDVLLVADYRRWFERKNMP
ncbi:asparagine synthase-related protein [Sphingomonas sp. GB1N7]|uniref:asparagine synthase-related protein n=1 Tax=Parasphingomonas caseinilytica TaxID=3096158 RepID=UPI002FCC524B